jgi:DNA-binding NarL/FixJ family response regulator
MSNLKSPTKQNPNQKGVFQLLSDREFEVAYLVVSGDRTIDIAGKLGVKTNTVSTFKRIICYKLNVSCTIELFKLAIKEKVIQLEN